MDECRKQIAIPDALEQYPLRGDEPVGPQAARADYVRGWNACRSAMLEAAPQPDMRQEDKQVSPNPDEVICPNCCHQFRAIPQNVQNLMLNAGFEPPFTQPVAAQEPIASVHMSGVQAIEGSVLKFDYGHKLRMLVSPSGKPLPLYTNAAPCARCSALNPQRLREFMRSMQAGEMTISRGIELLGMWLAGNYSDDQLPPVQNTLGEDEWPMQKITEQAAEIERLKKDAELHRKNAQILAIDSAQQADRIKALETEVERQRKVIKLCKEAMTWDVGGEPLPTLEVEALAAIAELEKGVG